MVCFFHSFLIFLNYSCRGVGIRYVYGWLLFNTTCWDIFFGLKQIDLEGIRLNGVRIRKNTLIDLYFMRGGGGKAGVGVHRFGSHLLIQSCRYVIKCLLSAFLICSHNNDNDKTEKKSREFFVVVFFLEG